MFVLVEEKKPFDEITSWTTTCLPFLTRASKNKTRIYCNEVTQQAENSVLSLKH